MCPSECEPQTCVLGSPGADQVSKITGVSFFVTAGSEISGVDFCDNDLTADPPEGRLPSTFDWSSETAEPVDDTPLLPCSCTCNVMQLDETKAL